MRLSPLCGTSTKPSEPSKVVAAAGTLFGSLLLLGREKRISKHVTTRSGARKIRICPARMPALQLVACLPLFIFFAFGKHYAETWRVDAVATKKNIDCARN